MSSLGWAIAVAIAIRFLVIEPFRIPTGSMAPTLLGEHAGGACPNCGLESVRDYPGGGEGDGPAIARLALKCPNCETVWPEGQAASFQPRPGDRVLVLKDLNFRLPGLGRWSARLRDPSRWSVLVFRSPDDRSKDYIKRLIGLPGEHLEIREGDIWVNGRIARKPPAVQGVLWQLVFDSGLPRRDRSWPWVAEGGGRWGEGGRLSLRAGGGSSGVRYTRRLDDSVSYNDPLERGADPERVGDARVELEAKGEAGARLYLRFAGERRSDERRVDFEAPPGSGRFSVPAGASCRISLERVDGRVVLGLCGREREGTDVEAGDPLSDAPVEIRAQGGAVEVQRIRIWRDIHYRGMPRSDFLVPADRFLFLGDNSPKSYDSRSWRVSATVPRQDLIGSALVVFWPPYRAGRVR